MSKDPVFQDKEHYLEAEREVYEIENVRKDTLMEDTWDTIKLLFKSFLPNSNS